MNSSLLSLDGRAGQGPYIKLIAPCSSPTKQSSLPQVELTVRFVKAVEHGGCRRGRRGPSGCSSGIHISVPSDNGDSQLVVARN